MAKRTTAARQNLDAEAALAFIEHRFSRHDLTVEQVAAQLLSTVTLEPQFQQDLLLRGLTEWARDHLLSEPRREILHAVSVIQHPPRGASSVEITVVRSSLRDWPIGVRKGLPLEACTPDDLEQEIHHSQRTAEEILRRVRVLKAAVQQARQRGCSVMGELPDDLLEQCLQQGRMD